MAVRIPSSPLWRGMWRWRQTMPDDPMSEMSSSVTSRGSIELRRRRSTGVCFGNAPDHRRQISGGNEIATVGAEVDPREDHLAVTVSRRGR